MSNINKIFWTLFGIHFSISYSVSIDASYQDYDKGWSEFVKDRRFNEWMNSQLSFYRGL